MNFARLCAFVLCFLMVTGAVTQVKPAAAANPPEVVVTIKPVHSLLAAVADGVFEPQVLLDGVSSPHHFQLKPSSVKLIYQSDRIFWVGEGLELFLVKTLRGVSDKYKAQKLIDVPGLTLLPLRERGSHDLRGIELDDQEKHGESSDQSRQLQHVDYHFWLDPLNASVLVGYFADTLADIDPANAKTYQANASSVQARLQLLTDELQMLLAHSRGTPYLVFHDSFQYFEKRFDLTSAGVITVQPETQPGAQRIRDLQQLIEHGAVKCIFSEPQFQSRSVQMLVSDAAINHSVIDPLGSMVPASTTMYFDWLRNTAITINGCLSE